MFYVYLITNMVNCKVYVGKTYDTVGRFGGHLYDARIGKGFAIHSAIRKYGPEAFAFEQFESFSKEHEAFDCERALIRILGTKDRRYGYNLTDGGEGCSGRVLSAETRRKIAQGQSGRTHSAEARRKMSEAARGRKHCEETRRKMSLSRTGKKRSPETVEKVRQALLGRTLTPEQIETLRRANLGKKQSPESNEKRRKWSTGRKHSEESLRLMSERQRSGWRARNPVRVEFEGRSLTLPEWSEVTGIGIDALRRRHNAGLPAEEILSTERRTNGCSSGGKLTTAIVRTCECGKSIRGPAFFNHKKRCSE